MYHILIVDDYLDYVTLVTRYIQYGLHQLGAECHCDTATTLQHTLDFLALHTVDLVVLDLKLSDATGVSGLKRVREAHPQVPILILTGNIDPDLPTIVRSIDPTVVFVRKDDLDLDIIVTVLQAALPSLRTGMHPAPPPDQTSLFILPFEKVYQLVFKNALLFYLIMLIAFLIFLGVELHWFIGSGHQGIERLLQKSIDVQHEAIEVQRELIELQKGRETQ